MADIYCFLCGANAEVSGILEAEIASAFAEARPGAQSPPTSSAFHFRPDDVEWQETLCLLGPLDEQHDELFAPHETAPAAIEAIDICSIRLVHPMFPGESHRYACVTSPTGREYTVTGNVYPFFHAGCFEIFEMVCEQTGRESWTYPERLLWAVVRCQNLESSNVSGINGVNYGIEIENTQGCESVEPLANLELAGCDCLADSVVRCLEQNEPAPFDVYLSWWLGPSAMWAFKRPDVFPVKEAYNDPFRLQPLPPAVPGASPVERLPVELLATIVAEFDRFTDLTSLLCVSKSIRHLCLTSMDILVRMLAPMWLIPPPLLLHKLKQRSQCSSGPFPWLRYVHYCRFFSPSMRNRWRIFGVCQQIVDIAVEMGDAELGQLELPTDMKVGV